LQGSLQKAKRWGGTTASGRNAHGTKKLRPFLNPVRRSHESGKTKGTGEPHSRPADEIGELGLRCRAEGRESGRKEVELDRILGYHRREVLAENSEWPRLEKRVILE